jgi:hypothetical protein
MVNEMARLILVPQYPTKLRYQEWWFTEFPEQFKKYFEEVIVLGENIKNTLVAEEGFFSPIDQALNLETLQIDEYMSLELRKDDILLLNDLSFPGLFAQVLFHKRPSKCFAICHATSKNAYDYYAKDRKIKYPIEKATAKLFDKIIVGSFYHKEKLGWPNIRIVRLPLPPFPGCGSMKEFHIASVARPGIQKHNAQLERFVEKAFGLTIQKYNPTSWEDYYLFLSRARVLLITSKEETYGYQVIDAIINGCIPIVPNAFSYPELLPKNYLYNNKEELLNLISQAINNELSPSPLLNFLYFYEQLYNIMNE